MESSSWTNKIHSNQANYATLTYFCWKHTEMLIITKLQLEKKPPRRQLLTFPIKDTSFQLYAVEQPWDTAVSHQLPLTERIISLRTSPVCCDIPHLTPVLWHEIGTSVSALPWLPCALRLFVVLALGAELSAEFKVCLLELWRGVKNTVPSLWITTDWKFIH